MCAEADAGGNFCWRSAFRIGAVYIDRRGARAGGGCLPKMAASGKFLVTPRIVTCVFLRNRQSQTKSPKSQTKSPKPQTKSPKSQTKSPKPQTKSPKSQTKSPTPQTEWYECPRRSLTCFCLEREKDRVGDIAGPHPGGRGQIPLVSLVEEGEV